MENIENILRAGVTGDQIIEAVTASGYPTQSIAVDLARKAMGKDLDLDIQEEWAYVDSDSGQVRQLDILAIKRFRGVSEFDPYDPGIPPNCGGLVRYEIALLAECKKSDLPFVFFLRQDGANKSTPMLLGLPNKDIHYGPSVDELFITTPTHHLLGEFEMDQEPLTAVSVSKSARKAGKRLELSGEEVYRALTLPVLKALRHFESFRDSPEMPLYHTVSITFPVVILDAPMVGVTVVDGRPELQPLEQVRLSVTEPSEELHLRESNSVRAIDFVSIEYLETYLADAIKLARDTVAQRLNEFATQMVTGVALVDFDIEKPEEGDTVENELPYRSMRPALTREEESQRIRAVSRRIHSDDPSAGTGPRTMRLTEL